MVLDVPAMVPVQDRNVWPGLAVALMVTVWPALYHRPLLGAVDPAPEGFTWIVK